jgi:ABC-type transport system substrate-binding protein
MQKLFAAMLLLAWGALGAETVYRRATERVASMDPMRSGSVPDARAVQLVYEPLLDVDYYARPYRLVPGLCDLPEVSDDRIVYTFRIREGVRFTDDPCFPGGRGRPVVAADVKYSLDRLADKSNASSGMWILDGVASVEAPDPRTVVIRLKKPLHVFPWLMAMAYAAPVAREAVEKYGVRFGGRAVGSGPYRLVEWWRGHRMVFERNKAWPGWERFKARQGPDSPPAGLPFEKLEYLNVEDVSTQWLMFLSGELDFLGEISRDNWDAVVGPDGHISGDLERRGVTLHAAAVMQVYYVGINMRDPVLGPNKKLRQALNCAFDFPAWQRFLNNRVMPADGPVPPGVNGRATTPFAYSFDLEKARGLLAEAGYPGGVDPKTGKRLVITLSMGRATQSAHEQAELLASFYDRVGVNLKESCMTWDAFLKAINEGRAQTFLIGWVGDYPDAENFMQLFHSKNASPGANHGNYKNPEFDRIYDEAMSSASAEERNALWVKSQEIVREDCPWIFLHYPKAYSLIRDRVRGYRPTDFTYGAEKNFRLDAAGR